MKKVGWLVFLFPGLVSASPFLVSDPWTEDPKPTHCELVRLSDNFAIHSAVAFDGNGNPYCKIDVAPFIDDTTDTKVWATSTVEGIMPSGKVGVTLAIFYLQVPRNLRLVE